MKPFNRRRSCSERDDSVSTVSDVAVMPPPEVRVVVRRSGSELSGSEVDKGKRIKLGSPLAGSSNVIAGEAIESAVSDGARVSEPGSPSGSRTGRSRKKVKKSRKLAVGSDVATGDGILAGSSFVASNRAAVPGVAGTGVVAKLGAIKGRLNELVGGFSLPSSDLARLYGVISEYELLVTGLIEEKSRLEGRLEAYEVNSGASSLRRRTPGPVAAVRAGCVTSGGKVASVAVREVSVPKVPETWSVVVKGKGGSSAKEVVDKVVKQVAPTLGVRVRQVVPTRDGGAVIRTPSLAERGEIVTNKKFGEVGLEVSVRDRIGPKIVVQDVPRLVSPGDFMDELYGKNFVDRISRESFDRSVRMVTEPWKKGDGNTGVILECAPEAAEHLRVNGAYILWFWCRVRVDAPVQTCHRCYGFDHRVSKCRMEIVCRRCGQCGHLASRCANPVHCRNCEFRGDPADHSMLSLECPVYALRVARANARH